jgi:hypothetical protein
MARGTLAMNEALEHAVSLSSLRGDAAAILARTPHGNLHAGIVYFQDGAARFLHLAWQDTLANDWTLGGVWACPSVEPERLESVAGMCRLVWREYENSQRFPYALRFEGTSFDHSGRLVLGARSRGLTCATFILAVLRSVGVTLVDEGSWPIRKAEDERFLDALSRFATTEHMAILRREVADGVKRIWPDEVIGACMVSSLPAAFDVVRRAADAVLDVLTSKPDD